MEDFHQETAGPTVTVPDSVREVFQLIFTETIVDHIVEESNRYACLVMGESKYEKWERLKRDDIFAYLGIMVMMGLVDRPSLHDYWKRDPLYYCPPIAERMSRDRFLEIHRYLHFVDNRTIIPPGEPGYDRLCKVRHVLSLIEDRFSILYNPHRECSIDEAMVPYKGRSSLKQYMPKKPVRRGLKVWMRADGVTGYVSQYQVYVGKEVSSETGLGARVVKDLTSTLVGKYYHIFCDNFFTSVKLFHQLHRDGVYATSTMRADRRGFPEALKTHVKKGLRERGESEIRQSEINTNLTVCVWQDSKPVTACSTFCPTTPQDTVERKMKNGERKTFPCPNTITAYNKFMGGVDKNDQLRQYYHVRLKSRKYYKYLFWMIFDVAITNALIIARANPVLQKETKSVKSFRTALSHELLNGYCSRKRKGRRPTVSTKKFHNEHYPFLGDGQQHRCEYCSLKGIRKATKWHCRDCNIYLCHKGTDTDCFLLYHLSHC